MGVSAPTCTLCNIHELCNIPFMEVGACVLEAGINSVATTTERSLTQTGVWLSSLMGVYGRRNVCSDGAGRHIIHYIAIEA